MYSQYDTIKSIADICNGFSNGKCPKTKRKPFKKVLSEAARVRMSPEYKAWRDSVLNRDRRICQACGRKNQRLQVHHIKGFFRYKELRTVKGNGITLCTRCHRKFHKKYGKSNFPDIRLVWELKGKK